MCTDRDTTLKLAKHITFQGLIADPLGNNVFEASGVRIVDDDYWVVFDNIFDLGKVHKDLPFLSFSNSLVTAEVTPEKDSEYEGITYDPDEKTFYLAQEAVKLKKGHFHANITQTRIDGQSYKFGTSCLSEIMFEDDNKGLEGLASVRVNGVLYLLGLCEGNHCLGGKEGREKGEGRLLVMNQVTSKSGECTWKTNQTLHIPKEANFEDYSDLAVYKTKEGKYTIAIISQENSQLWLGKLHIPKKRHAQWELETKAVYDFPRDNDCNIVFCNAEGIDFINENLIVVVSDRMKGHGVQPIWCLDKDQSIHIFSLPTALSPPPTNNNLTDKNSNSNSESS